MTGLANTLPSASNLGAIFGSAGIASPTTAGTPAPQLGLVSFLDLLGLFGGETTVDDSPVEDPLFAESPSVETATNLMPPVLVAPPPQIADALIRSMLQVSRVQVASAEAIPVQEETLTIAQPEPPAAATAPPTEAQEPDEQEVLIEEVAAPPAEQLEIPAWNPFPAAVSAAPPQAPSPEVPQREFARSAASPTPPVAAPVPPAAAPATPQRLTESLALGVTQTSPEKAPRKTERPAPLAFGLRLTDKQEPAKALAHPDVPAAPAAPPAPAPTMPQPAVVSRPVDVQLPSPLVSAAPSSVPPSNRPAIVIAVPSSTETATQEKPTGEQQTGQEPDTERRESEPTIPAKLDREPTPNPDATKFAAKHVEVPAASAPPASITHPDSRAVAIFPEKPSLSTPQIAPGPQAQVPATEPAPSPEIRTGTAHEIAVRISAPDEAPVDLHIAERGGEVRVAVRTADAGLQTSLRHDLGTLVDRLEHSGFHTEALIPRETSPSARIESTQNFDLSSAFRTHATLGVAFESSHPGKEGDSSQDNPSSGREHAQSDSGGRQQQQHRQNSSQRFEWMQTMEDQL